MRPREHDTVEKEAKEGKSKESLPKWERQGERGKEEKGNRDKGRKTGREGGVKVGNGQNRPRGQLSYDPQG